MPIDKFLKFYTTGVNAQGDNEAVAIGGDRRKADGKPDFRMRRWSPGREPEPTTQLYFCCSTVKVASARQRAVQRRLVDLVHTFVIVLDDVGTAPHSKVHPDVVKIAPTDRLETSPDNYQYFYKLEEGADPAAVAAVLEALAVAGWTDPGSTDAAHVFRVPGAVNEGRGGFKARLDEAWSRRERTWTLASLVVELAKHGVVVGSARPIAEELPPMAEGDVDLFFDRLQEADDRLILGAPERGWYPVLCCNEAEHTTGTRGDGSTGYKPSHGGGVFRCRHGHCKDKVTTADFQEWVWQRDAAGFRASLAAALNATVDVAPEGESVRFQPSPDQVMRDEMIENYIHVEVQNQYWSVRSKGLVERAAIDDRMTAAMRRTSLLHVFNDKGTRLKDMAVSVWLRGQSALRRVANLTHRLGQPLIVDDCINIAPGLPARLDVPGDPDLWFDLVDYVCGAQAELVLDWMAMVVTAFDEKPGWHVILKGPAHGTGKALMFSPLVRYLAPYKLWFGLKPVDISKQFTPFLERRLLILDELKRTTRGEITLSDIYNTIKAWTARGTGMVMIEKKNQQPYEACDLSCWVIFSNQDVPLPIEEGDRRFLVGNVPEPREEAYYKPIIKWLDQGGWQVVISYLHERWDSMSEADREMLRGRAPMSEAKADLIESSAEGIDGAVRAHIRGIRCEPWPDLMTMTDITSALRASEQLTEYYKSRLMSDQTVGRALRNAGAVQMFKGKQVEDEGRRMRLWCMRSARLKAYEKLGMGKAIFEAYRSMRTSSGANEAFNVVKFPPQR